MFVIDITKPLSTTVAVVPHDTNTNTVSCLAQWHPMLQKFIPVAQGTEELNLETATQLYDNVKADTFARLDQEPCIKITHPDGSEKKERPRRICCAACDSENVQVPVEFNVGEDGLPESAKFGKGKTHCPDCNQDGKGAKMKGYGNMYDHVQLVRDRRSYLDMLRAV
jgi:hypothetical protein